jgi:hypothetical protein
MVDDISVIVIELNTEGNMFLEMAQPTPKIDDDTFEDWDKVDEAFCPIPLETLQGLLPSRDPKRQTSIIPQKVSTNN